MIGNIKKTPAKTEVHKKQVLQDSGYVSMSIQSIHNNNDNNNNNNRLFLFFSLQVFVGIL